MPYEPHTLLSFGGKLSSFGVNSADEIWECGIRLTNAANDGPLNDPLTYVNGIAETLKLALLGGGSNDPFKDGLICTYATYEWVKCNNIDSAGHYSSNASNTVDLANPGPGVKAATHPTIMSLSVTWRSNRARGIGSHGRIYLPNAYMGLGAEMEVTAAETDKYANNIVGLLGILKTGPEVATPVIASRGANKGTGVGGNFPITSVRVGNIYDTQTRRKSALKEIYSSRVVPA